RRRASERHLRLVCFSATASAVWAAGLIADDAPLSPCWDARLPCSDAPPRVTLGIELMPSSPGERYDFFLSRRGSVAAIAREVTDVLTEKGYKVLVQDYDISLGASFIEQMHEGVSNSRDLIILFTHDYLQSPYTRKEFTSFEAERAQSQEERHIIVLRCDDAPLAGLLS